MISQIDAETLRGLRIRSRCRRSVGEVLGHHIHSESLAEREEVATLPAVAKHESHCEGLRVSLRGDAIRFAEQIDDADTGTVPRRSTSIRADRSGYVQVIDGDALLSFATERAGVTELLRMPREFVAAGTRLAVWHSDGPRDEAISTTINDAFSLGEYPTQSQDAMFSVHQLTGIATRALSPGVNDPKTAMICLDWLSVGLCVLAARKFPSAARRDDAATVRVIAKVPSFESLLDSALDQIRRYGRSDAEVLTRMLNVVGEVASCTRTGPPRDALRRHADLVRTEAEDGLTAEEAKAQVAARHRLTIQIINTAEELPPDGDGPSNTGSIVVLEARRRVFR